MDNVYSNYLWMRVYTDVSAQDFEKNEGSDAYVDYPDVTTDTICLPLGKHFTKFDFGVRAIAAASEKLTFNKMTHQIAFSLMENWYWSITNFNN